MPLSPRSPQPSPNPHSDRRRALPYTSKAREPAERKHDAETDLHRGVVLHGPAQVDSFEVLLDAVVGDDAHVELLFGGVQAQEGEAEEQGQGFGEEGDCEAGG